LDAITWTSCLVSVSFPSFLKSCVQLCSSGRRCMRQNRILHFPQGKSDNASFRRQLHRKGVLVSAIPPIDHHPDTQVFLCVYNKRMVQSKTKTRKAHGKKTRSRSRPRRRNQKAGFFGFAPKVQEQGLEQVNDLQSLKKAVDTLVQKIDTLEQRMGRCAQPVSESTNAPPLSNLQKRFNELQKMKEL
jgi:hypothetical protein